MPTSKQQLLKALMQHVRDLNLSRTDLDRILDAYWQCVSDVIRNGDSIRLGKIGTLHAIVRPARRRYNPLTGERYDAPEHNDINLHVSRGFRAGLN